MNKQYIQANHIIQRYLHGKLTAAEMIEFEEYLLMHPDMVEEFELSAIFKKTLGRAAKQPRADSSASKLLRLFWPLGGVLIGSAATWLLLGYQQPKHVATAISPDVIYIGEMRGVGTSQQPPVGAVLEPGSQQQILVLDVSMTEGQLFDVELQASNGQLLQSWPALKKNAQGELVILATLQSANAPSTIIAVRESNTSAMVLSATIITGAD
tara:strand:- start:8742 stop:9374 length:633 start_codon:yes stop_codon:yes gene_type:complete